MSHADMRKNEIGLGHVDDTSDASKPVSAAEQAALDLKADASSIPSALSQMTGDSTHRVATDAEKAAWNAKEAAISTGSASQFFSWDKTMRAITAVMVGLGLVDNTSDASKPVSALQQAEINRHIPFAFSGTTVSTTGQFVVYLTANGLVGGTPIFASVSYVHLNHSSNDPNLGKSYTLSGVTLTIIATKQTFASGNVLLNLLGTVASVLTGVVVAAAPAGTALTGLVEGIRN